MSNAYRDQNSVPTLIATSNVDGFTPVRVYADPITHRLLVDNSGGSTTTSVYGEVPSGSGTTFSLANNPVAGTVRLYRGGARQQAGVGNDYTISGSTITLYVGLSSGEVLLADYNY